MAVVIQRYHPSKDKFVTVTFPRGNSVRFEDHAGQLVAQVYNTAGHRVGAVVNPAAVLDR